MLTRLELSGFKSFADKTRLEFPPGVSAIVGPNGSGKSNVVDAIRWVLGEQSAKSLRGDGMTDVIFNGSATRKPMSQAEVTLVLDNLAGDFPLPVPEVRIARRVNRQGESDYLINGRSCRLKDIRDLFLGSGAGSDSFCVIQQGQVHALLQASPKDRRSLFEEAAGISRFKLRRLDAHKRLEKIDQNIGRCSDVLSEVERQYQSAKLQSSKAEQYLELRKQIREIRLRLSWQEWREIQERLPQIEEALGQAVHPEGLSTHEPGYNSGDLLSLEIEATELATRAEEARSKLENSQKLLEGAFQSRAALAKDLAAARQRHGRMLLRHRDGKTWITQADREINLAESEWNAIQPNLVQSEETDNLNRQTLADLRGQADTNRGRQLDALRRQNLIGGNVSTLSASLEQVNRALDRSKETKEQHFIALEKLQQLVERLQTEEARAQVAASISLVELENLRNERETKSRQLTLVRNQHQKMLVERGEIRSRLEVLEQLELSQEGLAPGVRSILNLKKESGNRLWNGIIGLVADSLRVRREYSHLIEIALGDHAQRFLAENRKEILTALTKEKQIPPGRVGFLFPEKSAANEDETALSIVKHPGLVAKASHLAICEHKKFIGLPDRLLGKTLIVRDLESAFQLASKLPDHRFVTLAGEMLDEFGSVILGKASTESGVLSRKNELKDLRERLGTLEKELLETENRLSIEKGHLENLESRLESLDHKARELTQTAADLTSRLDRERLSLDTARQEQLAGEQEERRLSSESERLAKELADQKKLLEAAEKATSGFQSVLDQINLQIEEIGKEETLSRVEADKLRSKAAQLDLKIQVLKRQKAERALQVESLGEDITREEKDLRDRTQQLRQIDLSLLATAMEEGVAQMERDLTREKRRLAEVSLSRRRQELELLARETSQQLNEINQRRAHYSGLEKERQRLTVRLEQIQERLREEDIPDINHIIPEASWHNQSMDRARDLEALKDLQSKIQRLGLINHEAARELGLIEERRQGLSDQIEDLQMARKNLVESLARLNETATTRFLESFTAIQEHFRELFRKIFGGGTAELSLEDPGAPLDTGIEVLARPPGKDAARLSLMSGGERTMTAVALLLAVFKSRPGPFCLMDEVDAALDEANVDRFAGVLKEFSEKTQFILISHHKRTMASASVLHGITMKEPGVSIRYSVDIEDYMGQGKHRGNDSHLAA